MLNLGQQRSLIAIYIIALIFSFSGFAVADQIHDAARDGDLAKVKSLIAEGSDVNAADKMGANPLHLADQAGYQEVVDLLIKYGGHK